MFTYVHHWVLVFFIYVYASLLVITYVYNCFTYVYSCLPMLTIINSCCTYVYLFTYVYPWLLVFTYD